MTLADFITCALLALALGPLIGLERPWRRRRVDLKTNALECVGAALFMITAAGSNDFTDAARVAAQIVVGVGFIGGGLLFRERTQTRCINTAATLWCCAAVGTLCGMGRWQQAAVAAVLLVVAHTLLRDVAHRLQVRMGLNDSLTEQLLFKVEHDPAQATAMRRALRSVLTMRHGELRSVRESRSPRGTALLAAGAAFDSPNLVADIDAVPAAVEALGAPGVPWR